MIVRKAQTSNRGAVKFCKVRNRNHLRDFAHKKPIIRPASRTIPLTLATYHVTVLG